MNREEFLHTNLVALSYRVARAQINELTSTFNENGHLLTVEQFRVLLHLSFRDGLTQHELSQSMGQEKTGVSRLVAGLEKGGYITRLADNHDRRNKRVFLTPKGVETHQDCMELLMKTLDKAQQGIDSGELETCKRVLRQVMDNLSS